MRPVFSSSIFHRLMVRSETPVSFSICSSSRPCSRRALTASFCSGRYALPLWHVSTSEQHVQSVETYHGSQDPGPNNVSTDLRLPNVVDGNSVGFLHSRSRATQAGWLVRCRPDVRDLRSSTFTISHSSHDPGLAFGLAFGIPTCTTAKTLYSILSLVSSLALDKKSIDDDLTPRAGLSSSPSERLWFLSDII